MLSMVTLYCYTVAPHCQSWCTVSSSLIAVRDVIASTVVNVTIDSSRKLNSLMAATVICVMHHQQQRWLQLRQ
jgi:hypothetical protein